MTDDRRDRLTADPFTHRATRAGTVRVSRGGRVVTPVGDARAERLLRALEAADGDEDEIQQLLARATGNYRRGNERSTGGTTR